MKTYKNLYPKIYEFENLYRAYRKARRGKRNGPAVAAFETESQQPVGCGDERIVPASIARESIPSPKWNLGARGISSILTS